MILKMLDVNDRINGKKLVNFGTSLQQKISAQRAL